MTDAFDAHRAITVEVTVNADTFRFDGHAPFSAELRGAFTEWLGAVTRSDDDDDTRGRLSAIQAQLRALLAKDLDIMATVTSIKQLVTDLDTETTAIATRVDAQTAEIARLSAIVAAGGTVTQADLDAISDGLTPISARLKALGTDPADPIPAA